MSVSATRPKWTTATLAEIAEIERLAVSPENIPSGTTYVGLENITSNGGFVNVGTVANGQLASTKFRFTPSHILYGKLRPYLAKIARPDFEGVCSTDILPIQPGPKVDRGYLLHFLRQPHMIAYASSRTSGANLPRLSPNELAAFEIPLPPLNEQKWLADILDKADAICCKRRTQQEERELLRKSVFANLFGDPATHTHPWERRHIGDMLSNQRAGTRCGPFGTALKKNEYTVSGVPVWGIENVTPDRFVPYGSLFISEEKYDDLRGYSVVDGDLLISRAGSVGRICVARPGVKHSIIGTNLIRVSLNSDALRPEYLSSLLTYFGSRVGPLRVSSDDDAYSFMKTSVLARLQIPVPPISKQMEYVSFLDPYEKGLAREQQGAREAHALKAALTQRAFQGQL